ncbi:MAG TPA: FAD-binding protein [Streptosporangiaceae bacterium]|nr:FAD-binding protein [Streptosporangiaceae bacterium]
MTADFDVIVIGGGLSGGLPAAAYLQKAGLQVLIVEANAELGSFCCTHETWPQVLDSPHVGVSFAGNSPVIEDLDLERYGFRFAASPVVLATAYRDGTNCLICQDPARTAENFARHNARDSQRMLEIQSRVHETMVEFNELSSFSPHPDPSRLPRVRGQGAFGTTFARYYTTGVGVGGNEVQVDALTRCFLDHGGEVWTSAAVSSLVLSGGRVAGIRLSAESLYPGREVRARRAVISNAGVPETLRLAGDQVIEAADPLLAAKMRYWKMGLRGSHVTSWLLDRRVSWASADFDPLIDDAISVYRMPVPGCTCRTASGRSA